MVPKIKLNDGNTIPQIGLGLWKVTDKGDFDRAFDVAVKAGYRHFDTAQAYGNEQYLGEAWKRAGLKRKDIFITTKINVIHFGASLARRSFVTSLKKLQTDYVDLLLLHFPLTGIRKSTWTALEKLQAEGLARSIGVSNYTVRHLEEMPSYATVMPAVNQVELHVFLQQPELLDYCRDNQIAVEAYSPLAHAREMREPVISKIAKKHGKTYAQIMLRWCVEKDTIALPKSVTPERIRENMEIFDFKLDADDIAKLAGLDRDLRTAWSPVHVP